jgi:hypothetical protein
MYLPDAVATAVARLSAPDVPGIVYGEIDKVDANGSLIAQPRTGAYSLENWLLKQTYIPQPAAFFRRELLDQAGLWDPDYFIADTEFWLRALWRAPVRKVQHSLSLRRMHAEQRDTQREQIVDSYARMIDRSPLIRSLPPRFRRAAAAGKWLHRVRYSRPDSRFRTAGFLWMALIAYPRIYASLEGRTRLVPFSGDLWAAARAARRKLGIPRPW